MGLTVKEWEPLMNWKGPSFALPFFCQKLRGHQMDFYCGVPDSLLKDFCGFVADNVPATNHQITPNEGLAVGLASGYFLNTNKIPIVYFQNSGLGNAVNPLLSLTHQKVYSIPMLLIIGWRGEIGKKDEPQHLVTGEIMLDLLKLLQIPYDILPDYEEGIEHSVQTAAQYMRTNNAPYALCVRKRTFETYKGMLDPTIPLDDEWLTRREALEVIVNNAHTNSVFISNTGFASRELYEIRTEYQKKNNCLDVKEFLTVGSMGHSSSIAMGMAHSEHIVNKQGDKRDVVCIDGDGALLMHMGTMSMIGNSELKNIKHILINNGCHDSVGSQPTDALKTDFVAVAKNCGYKKYKTISKKEDIVKEIQNLHNEEGPYFLEIKTNHGVAKNLSRPKTQPHQNKHDFMSFIDKTKTYQ